VWDGGATAGQGAAGVPVSRPADDAVADLLGTGRARLLQELRSLATTISLARSLEVSPLAVSQHLAAFAAAAWPTAPARAATCSARPVTSAWLSSTSPRSNGRRAR
jgi:hypothetical protein